MKSALLIVFTLASSFLHSQVAGEWTWMHGSNANPSPPGVFGTQGVSAPTNRPPGLYEACEWTDLQGNFWLYGGQGGTGLFNTLWKFDPLSNEWTWMHGSGFAGGAPFFGTINVPSANNTPGARGYGCISITDLNGDLWLFGGSGAAGCRNDLWRYNIASNMWTWMGGSQSPNDPGTYGTIGVPSVSNIPAARSETAAGWCDNNNNLWLYGGEATVWTYGRLHDLWKYNIATGEWTLMTGSNMVDVLPVYGTQGVASPSNDPGNRNAYAHWKDLAGNLWLYGGQGSVNSQAYELGDLWRYEVSSNQWTWMSGTVTVDSQGVYTPFCDTINYSEPGAMMENRACWVDTCGNFWMFGGALNYGNNNLWCYRVAQNDWVFVNGDGATYGLPSWGSMGVSSPANQPPSKAGANGWVDNSGNLWLYGGGDGICRGDMWRYVPDYDCIGSCARVQDSIPEPVNDSVFIPNVFSPDGNAVNDEFEIRAPGSTAYDLQIFNRWGIEVFHSASNTNHWNGKLQNTGNDCVDGTYYYILRVAGQSGIESRYSGFLTLIR